MQTINKNVIRYRNVYRNAENRRIDVIYKRKRDLTHNLVGRVLKTRKSSLILIVNDELKVNIGYRNIKRSFYLDSSFKIKSRLYYNLHNKY